MFMDKTEVRKSDVKENCIEWLTGEQRVALTITQKKFKSRIKNYADKYPDEVKILHENADGSIYCHMPLKYIHITRTREMTEEEKQAAKERLQKYRKNG